MTAVALATVAGFSLVGPAPAAFAATDTVANLSAEFAAASDGDTITLTQDLTGTAADPRVMVPTLTSVILDLNGKALILIGPTNLPGMWVPNGSRLTIHDSGVGGSLSATGGQAGAGIGGGLSGTSGEIVIDSGTIDATGGDGAAGIGGGWSGNGGLITINGGTVTATGGDNGAGIGGGYYGDGGTITVNSGAVSATGTGGGAGIGGGYWQGDGAAVTIGSGATVTASAASQIAIGPGFNAAVFGSLSNAGLLTIPASNSITVLSGSTATNTGTIINNGSLAGAGGIQNDGIILNLGTVGSPANVSVHNVTVALDGNGGTTPANPDVIYAGSFADGQVAFPAPSTRSGHTFSGWFTAVSGGTRVTDTTNLGGGGPKTMTLYAQWDDFSTLAATGTSPTGWPLLGAGLLLAGATLLLLRRRVRKS